MSKSTNHSIKSPDTGVTRIDNMNSASSSPVVSPAPPMSEPPTPTTGHVSSPLPIDHVMSMNMNMNDMNLSRMNINGVTNVNNSNHSSNSNSSSPKKLRNPYLHKSSLSTSSSAFTNNNAVLQQRSMPKSNYNYTHNHNINAPYPMQSHFSITSSARSVKSIGSSIIDTDYETDTGASLGTRMGMSIGIGPIDNDDNDHEVDVDDDDDTNNNDDDDEEENGDDEGDDIRSVPMAITAEVEEDENENPNMNKNDNNTNDNDNDDLSHDDDDDENKNKNPTLIEVMTEFRNLTIHQMSSIQKQQKRDMDRLTTMLQNESNRRQALEGRFHAQLLLQAETMVAMEVKLLKLEAQVEKDAGKKSILHGHDHDRNGHGHGSNHGHGGSASGSNHVSSQGHTHAQGHGHGHGHGHNTPTQAPHNQFPYMNVEGRTGSIVANETIDEEEDFPMRDIKEIQVRTRSANNNPNSGDRLVFGVPSSTRMAPSLSRDRISGNPTNIIMSSGASLASGVTATSFLEETHGVEDQHHTLRRRNGDGDDDEEDGDDDDSARSNDGDVEDEGDGGDIIEGDGSASTPTQGGSRRDYRFADMQPVTNLESILLNPIQSSVPSEHALSTRAVRGDYDGNSSLATSMTNTTVTSTIVTATTRGNESIRQSLLHDAGSVSINEEVELATAASGSEGVDLAHSTASISQREEYTLCLSPQNVSSTAEEQERPPRNESPLTVQSGATETRSVGQSVASASVAASVGTSIISTAAVAPARSFRFRREAASRLGHGGNLVQDGRQWANRVVSFMNTSEQVFPVPPDISEAGDSITMPDELDNLSDVADEFANRARVWRDEYEARLDAIQKRWSGE